MDLNYLSEETISHFIKEALQEDLGDGDHTSLATLPENLSRKAQLVIKGSGVLAGVQLAEKIFSYDSAKVSFEKSIEDGAPVNPRDIAFIVSGDARTILSRERLVLNCMQRMSGIATYTSTLQSMISHTKARVTDTRKTTPNFRLLEKWAVAIGGGINHRIGLYDKILLKDNHVDFCGGIPQAILAAREYLSKLDKKLAIEIETRSLKEVKEAIDTGGFETIMLDNMSTNDMKEATGMINGKYIIEASGNITEENIVEVAECGVDVISVGALTHSYKSLDMSLKAF